VAEAVGGGEGMAVENGKSVSAGRSPSFWRRSFRQSGTPPPLPTPTPTPKNQTHKAAGKSGDVNRFLGG